VHLVNINKVAFMIKAFIIIEAKMSWALRRIWVNYNIATCSQRKKLISPGKIGKG
jgi:hypothetical protein